MKYKHMNFGTELDNVYGSMGDYDTTENFKKDESRGNAPTYEDDMPAPPRGGAAPQMEEGGQGQANIMNDIFYQKRLETVQRELEKQRQITATLVSAKGNTNGSMSKLVARKRDALKLLSFSLVILLAVSMHTFFDFSIKKYLQDNDVECNKEYLIRIMYPITVFMAMWMLKAYYL
jgi:hypothetical protein